jgi:hypothetical protein
MSERQQIEQMAYNDRSELSSLFFDEDEVSYQAAMLDEIFLSKQPFDYDPLSPTPLDPFHLKTSGPDYYHAALMLMDERVDSVGKKYNIPQEIKDLVSHEIAVEHEHRSHKNNAAMREFRKSIDENSTFSREYANDIVAARAGVSDLGRLAILLAKFPSMGGIEVMKYTKPFENRDMVMAHATLISRVRMTEMKSDGNFEIVDNKIEMAQPSIVNTANNVGPYVVAFKGKEAEIVVNGQPLELMGRYSYIAMDDSVQLNGVEPITVSAGSKTANVQPIAITKYLRLPRE